MGNYYIDKAQLKLVFDRIRKDEGFLECSEGNNISCVELTLTRIEYELGL